MQAKKNAPSRLSVMELCENIVELSDNECAIDPNGAARSFVTTLSKRLGITPIEALLLAVFVNMSNDSRINYLDLARHFDVRPIRILSIVDHINSLAARELIIKRRDHDGDVSFRIPQHVIDHLRRGELPSPAPITGLQVNEFIDRLFRYLNLRGRDELEDEELYLRIHQLIDGNLHLDIAQQLSQLKVGDSELVLFLRLTQLFVNNHDDCIMRNDIDDYFHARDLRTHLLALENGTHTLMHLHLAEHHCNDGKVDPQSWKLTDHAKRDILADLKLAPPSDDRTGLTLHEDIVAKPLYYSPAVTRQVDELRSLLDGERMQRVMQRLADRGMRRGFTCIFYGAPGTGKTETVLQLARQTGRDIMMVDVPSIRSKWVGETEQNIKAVFERYARLAAKNKLTPILLFNEADALLNKRAEGAVSSVDKMENAMQNIILQEMERLEGIMIATTNLTGSLDAAFERRFLYKIEFTKPTPAERSHIWQAMLPELTPEQSLHLAETYDLSGGQIENVARKQTIAAILSDSDTLSLPLIEETCRQEHLTKKSHKMAIGFKS